ncbi:MAG: hypothetical protein JXB39_02585 [Deltaproteobacteria bacterium]|nr:hypothetical protein [Deltaproteobacteria bacterium]
MPASRSCLVGLALLLISACGGKEPPPPPEDPCPNVHVEKLAGDWIKVVGSKADHRSRMRISGTPDAYEMILVPGNFDRVRLRGRVSGESVDFEQVLTEEQEGEVLSGDRIRNRLSVRPTKAKCALRVRTDMVSVQNGVERTRTGAVEEYVTFPEDFTFTFDPPDGPLFMDAAAKSRTAMEAEIRERGGPNPEGTHSTAIPVGVFVPADQDGDPSCTYDFDLYFDDQPYKGESGNLSDGQRLAAGEVQDGYRHWYVPAWYAPYSGNHHFEMFRYRTCSGKPRERIAVQSLDALLY